MGPSLLLLLMGLTGHGSADSRPELLQAPVGATIVVQCHYRLQDVRAPKTWCRFFQDRCQPLVSSVVDRRLPGSKRTFLTDMGGGLLQVEMVSLGEEDSGEYGCVVDGARGPQTLHTVSLQVLPRVSGPREKEEQEEDKEQMSKTDNSDEDPSTGPVSSASPHEKRIPLIWGAVLLLGLLVAAMVLLAVIVRRKGNRLGVCGKFQNNGVSSMDPSSAAYHINDSAQASGQPSDVPFVRLDSPPSFDTTTYSSILPDSPSGKPPPPQPPLPPKVLTPSKSVTYATVIFPGGDRGGGASREPAQDPPNSQPPSS